MYQGTLHYVITDNFRPRAFVVLHEAQTFAAANNGEVVPEWRIYTPLVNEDRERLGHQ